ncbi:PQQ-like beta-propeller repeat protein [Candidatus Uabimicrobium amorphum]|uniref:Alcohol dehydrogenase n=1 Tax=Uabimicrobium amorphum TaxID=2596890 RepID=A0A5S9IMG2_UABAM|nr:PQQ-like beta-propeller repeat protein [Candidatus Uabimicrobium amorphum]BBM83750.1 alcohol dehydrogenase [Candidatus Uabimicrobium amorphum]
MKQLLLILVFLSVCFADDWPYFLGQDLNGISKETQISKNWKVKQPQKLWEVKIGDGYSGITVVGDLVYTAYGKNREEYCIAVKNGEVVWKKVIGPYFYSRIGSGPRTTPTIHEGRLYIVGAYGDFHCLDAKTGKTLWNFNILRKFKTKNLKWGMCSSPVIYKHMLLYNVGGNNGNSIVALDQKTGNTLWQSGSDSASYATPTIAKICGEDQAIFFTGNGLYTVDPNNGKYLWSFSWPVYKNAATPICRGDYVFLSSSYGQGAGALLHIKKNGNKYNVRQIWKNRRFKNHYTTSILWQDHLYGFHNNIFTCVNFNNGGNTWVQRGFKKGLLIATNDGHAVVLGQAGNLALVKLNPQRYIELGTYKPFGKNTNCLVIPTLANGMLYVRDNERLICLDISN